jgi:hypothetical protein
LRFPFLGGGSSISEAAAMRNRATRADISFKRPNWSRQLVASHRARAIEDRVG